MSETLWQGCVVLGGAVWQPLHACLAAGFSTKAIEGAGHFVQQREIAAWPFLFGWLVVPMAR